MKFKIERKLLYIIIFSTAVSGAIAIVNYSFLLQFTNIYPIINILAIIVFLFPLILVYYTKYRKRKEIEELFPVFLRDFVESVRGGMTIPHAFNSVAKNDYKNLTPHIRKIAAQLEWGISVDKVLMKFSKESNSRIVGRIISSVIESHRFGGNLVNTFEALSNTAVEIEHLRAERRLYLQSQMITGYIIFFVFLGVIIGLEQFLVPSLTQVSPFGGLGGASQEGLANSYRELFRNLILIQGLFAGLTVGKMAEGAIIAGIKHSLFMMFVGGLVFSIFG